MRIVVDTNRILSALLKDGMDRKIISSQNINFFTLDYVLEEIGKYMGYIIKKSGLPKEEIETLLSLFMENVAIVSDKKVKSKMKEAMDIMKDIDAKDAPILACALAVPNDGIWSEDKHVHKQSVIKALHSADLLNYI